jgi:hypothetical protein
MSLEKKPPRFVPTLTEVVQAKPVSAAALQNTSHEALCEQAMVASEQFLAQRLPELAALHMAACEAQLRQELEILVKKIVAGDE